MSALGGCLGLPWERRPPVFATAQRLRREPRRQSGHVLKYQTAHLFQITQVKPLSFTVGH
jgi:hypothetical protein